MQPSSEATGSFHVCSRCGLDSDAHPYALFLQIGSCALLRGDWLCDGCRRVHRAACPICRPLPPVAA